MSQDLSSSAAAAAPSVPSSSTTERSLIDSAHDELCRTVIEGDMMRDKIEEAVSKYMKLQHKKQSEETALTRFISACNTNLSHTSLPRQLALNLKAKVRLPTEDSDPAFFKEEEATLQAVEQEASKKIYEIVSQARKRHIDHLAQRLELPRFIPQQVAAFSSSADEIAKIAQEHIQSSSNALSVITFPKQKLIDHFRSTLTSEITKAVAARVLQQQQMELNREQQRQADEKAKDDAMKTIHTGQALKHIARQEANQAMIPLVNEHAKLKHKQHLTHQLLSNYAAAAASASATSTSSSEHRPNNKRKNNRQRNNDANDNNDDLEEGNAMEESTSSPNPPPLHSHGRPQKRGKHTHPTKSHFHQGGQQLMNQLYQVAAPIHQFPTYKQAPQPARRQQ